MNWIKTPFEGVELCYVDGTIRAKYTCYAVEVLPMPATAKEITAIAERVTATVIQYAMEHAADLK